MNAATGALKTLREGARKRPFLAGLIGALVAVVVLVSVLYVLPPNGRFFGDVSDAVVVQSIASGAIVLAAVLPALLSTRRSAAAAAKDAAVVREEVKNNHTTNFREDHDAHKDEILRAVAALRDDVREDLREVRSDIRGLRRDGGRRDDRIQRLEDATFALRTGDLESDALGSLADTVTKRQGSEAQE